VTRLAIGHFVVDWVAERLNCHEGLNGFAGIGLQGPQNRLIAGVVYANYNGVNVECHIASDGSKRWMTKEYLRVIFDYPYNQLKCNRITVCVGQGNKDSQRFVEHLGFTLEARLADAHPTGDILIYSLRKPECKWLNLRKETEHEQMAA
jgi:RimJ/RimL family protein N-acetyltransferase